jgi:hypothetical protein
MATQPETRKRAIDDIRERIDTALAEADRGELTDGEEFLRGSIESLGA